jgi:hypothetical protein
MLLVIKTFTELRNNRFEILHSSEVYSENCTVTPSNCTSILFINKSAGNIYILSNILLEPNETLEFNNHPGNIIKTNFDIKFE